MILSDKAVCLVAKSYHNITKDSVIHVLTALPHDLPGIDVQIIALLDMIVQQRSQQVVGRGDGMKITGKMQIQFIHRHYLCIAAAGSSTFDTKAGA